MEKKETPELINLLIEKIRNDYRDDIAIIFLYGSYLRQDYHSLSDIDLFIIAKTEKGRKLGFTFILNDIGYDLWTVTWEWAESVADYKDRSPSLIIDGKVVYHGTDEDLARFTKLQGKAFNVNREKYTAKASESMKELYKTVFLLNNSDDLTEIRKYSIEFVYILTAVLAQINCANLKGQRKFFRDEILRLKNIPENFAENYDSLIMSKNIDTIKKAANYLTYSTGKILSELNLPEESASFIDCFGGWYEEMIQHYNKIYFSCEKGDFYSALFAGAELESELDYMLSKTGSKNDLSDKILLPGIVKHYDPANLTLIKNAVKQNQNQLEKLLAENNVPVLRFNDLDEFKIFLKNK